MTSRSVPWGLLLAAAPMTSLLLSFALGCGGGAGATAPDDDAGTGDTDPAGSFLVVGTEPGAGASDVETGVTVVATFNRAPDPATLTPSSVTIARHEPPGPSSP
ncbi:MAG: hypothetical protein ACREOF_00600 [Gemmatimonadales bacterium]